jgi:hypothetical protein
MPPAAALRPVEAFTRLQIAFLELLRYCEVQADPELQNFA